MGESGKKDKGQKEQRKKPKLTQKEKRKQKNEKKHKGSLTPAKSCMKSLSRRRGVERKLVSTAAMPDLFPEASPLSEFVRRSRRPECFLAGLLKR